MAGGFRKKLAARLKKVSAKPDADLPPSYEDPPAYSDLGITETDIVDHYIKSLEVGALTEKLDILVKSRCDATGTWALQTSAYVQWRSESGPALLWCCGKPGAGKSVISAMLTKEMQDEMSFSKGNLKCKIALAYIFLDYKVAEGESDATLSVVQSLIFQLGRSSIRDGRFPSQLEKLSRNSSPDYEDYVSALQAIVSIIGTVNIVLDALDETDRTTQSRILTLLDNLLLSNNTEKTLQSDGDVLKEVHVLLSSRRNDIITSHYEHLHSRISASTFEVRATDEDIRVYIDRTLATHERRMRQDRKSTPLLEHLGLRDEVVKTLVDKADGMFLWAKLQTSHLQGLPDHLAVQDFLNNLPVSEDIENTYIQMLLRIQAQGDRERRLAQKALLWVAHAIRPLSLDELKEATNIDEPPASKQDSHEPYHMANRRLIASCASFIEVGSNNLDSSSSTSVAFVHYTAMEFFRRTGSDLVRKFLGGSLELDHFFPSLPLAHLQLGKWATSYLITSFGKEKATFALQSPGWFLMTSQLAHYACVNFDQHLYRADDALDNEAILLAEKFLAFEGGILEGFMLIRTMESTWDIMAFEEMKFWPGNTTRETIIRSTALQPIPMFTLQPASSIDEEIKRNRWILHHAAFSGDIELVESILKNVQPESGFISREDTRGATALYYAARQGSVEICRRLLDVGGIAPDAGLAHSNPLQVAALNGHLDVVKLLLEKGADSRAQGGLYNTALQAASWNGHYSIADLFLKQGKKLAEVNAVAKSKTPRTYCALQAAAFRGHDAVVRRLIEAGAKPNIPEPYTSQFGLPLQAAVHGGHLSIAQILLDVGADINAQSGERESGGTALIAAAANGNDAAVRFLIKNGAIVARSKIDNEPHKRSEEVTDTTDSLDDQGNAKVIQSPGMSDRLSDPTLSDQDEWESEDDNANGPILDGEVALHWALARGHYEVVKTLMAHGASLVRSTGKYGNSIQAAVVGGNERLVRMTLDAGIDVNAPGGYFATSLIAAGKEGNIEVVRMLLDAGADMEPLDYNYGNALDAACYAHNYDVVELLLERGASVRNALPEIASTGNVDLAKKMIDKGADVNAVCRSPYKTALQAAAWGGRADMVKLFLDHGADPNFVGGVYGTALHAAIRTGSLETVKNLVQAGADVNSRRGRDPKGTPLQVSCLNMEDELARYLLDHGAKVNLKKPCGEFGSALQAAVTKNWEPLVRLLLDRGADVLAEGGKYGNSLNAAKEIGNEDLVNLLTEHIKAVK